MQHSGQAGRVSGSFKMTRKEHENVLAWNTDEENAFLAWQMEYIDVNL